MNNVISSFRDPSGHLFWHKGKLYRTVTDQYIGTYRNIKKSGLFDSLRADKKIIDFKEQTVEDFPYISQSTSLILQPDILPFISYPYEWSFSQLKDAALLTLDLHITALKNNFLLKDASAFNVQFLDGKPIFIDHLSFDVSEKYPIWPAYGQFCRHFLAPLVLIAKVDPGLNSLLKIHMDGIPLHLARRLVPMRKLLTFGLFIHFFWHANSQQKYADKGEILRELKRLSPRQMLNLAFSLRDTIDSIRWQPKGTEWIDYYNDTNYSDTSMNNKIEMVRGYFEKIPHPRMVWDFGGNTGFISRAVQEYADHIICFDVDVAAVEKNYLQVKENRETKILPLVMDFNNPSSSIGFASRERFSLKGRGRADLGLALALIHHLAISNNIPFSYLAEYFSSLCNYLIIEFVPKEDSQVQRLLLSREDIFPEYNIESFEKEFSRYFNIISAKKVLDSERTLFLMGIS